MGWLPGPAGATPDDAGMTAMAGYRPFTGER